MCDPFDFSLTHLLGSISQKSLRRRSRPRRIHQQGERGRRAPASTSLRRREDLLSMYLNGRQGLRIYLSNGRVERDDTV